jgi:hypothetical protein
VIRTHFDDARIPLWRESVASFDQLTQVIQAAGADRPVYDDVLSRHRRPEQRAAKQGIEHGWRRERSDSGKAPPQVETPWTRAFDILTDEPANEFAALLTLLEPDLDGL